MSTWDRGRATGRAHLEFRVRGPKLFKTGLGSLDFLVPQLKLLLQVVRIVHSRLELHRILRFELVLRAGLDG